MDNLRLSEGLRRAFKSNGIALPRNTTVSIQRENLWWLITDQERNKTYTIRKTADWLNVYPPNFAKYPQDFVTAQGNTYPVQRLTTMLAHDGQYLYAAAQIGGVPEIIEELLFRAELTFQRDLDNLQVLEDLRREFETNSISLSQNTIVSIKEEDLWWLITDQELNKRCSVRKAANRLDISLEERATDRNSRQILNRDEHFALFLAYETKRLFGMDLVFQSDLDTLSLSADVRQAFEKNGLPLSQSTTISIEKKDKRWRITDKGNKQTYIIKKKEKQLNICRSNIYTFGVNVLGIQIDMKRSDLTWNLDWQSCTVATETAWTTEISIPLIAFGADLYESEWRIGIRRSDEINDEIVTLAPSFTITSRENRLPEYRHTVSDLDSLLPLTFENITP